MTPKEVAQKHYQDHQFDECKLHCMRCDDEWCESQVIAIKELEADIIQCIETHELEHKKGFRDFAEEMQYIVKTTPKEVLKEEWDKVLEEYGTDTHDKILSMTDDFVQSNRSEGQTYAHYHYDMMADFALHILETFKTK